MMDGWCGSCFNSLQTGKRIQRLLSFPEYEDVEKFQFPSNGKAYPKWCQILMIPRLSQKRVSIPFKRESVSKVNFNHQTGEYTQEVSIPFKRESVSKEKQRPLRHLPRQSFNSLQTGKRIQSQFDLFMGWLTAMFQFPSNGKAYPKSIMWGTEPSAIVVVSIPFKRESVSKGSCRKPSRSGRRFQFPSNGKAYPKYKIVVTR